MFLDRALAMQGQWAERFTAAKLAGISLRRLRQLEREGRIRPATRTLGGMPLYALSQVEEIRKADTACREAGERNRFRTETFFLWKPLLNPHMPGWHHSSSRASVFLDKCGLKPIPAGRRRRSARLRACHTGCRASAVAVWLGGDRAAAVPSPASRR